MRGVVPSASSPLATAESRGVLGTPTQELVRVAHRRGPPGVPRGTPGRRKWPRLEASSRKHRRKIVAMTRDFSAETEGFEPSVPVRGLHLSRVKSRPQRRANAVKSAKSRTPDTPDSPRIGMLRMLGVTWGSPGWTSAVPLAGWTVSASAGHASAGRQCPACPRVRPGTRCAGQCHPLPATSGSAGSWAFSRVRRRRSSLALGARRARQRPQGCGRTG